MGSVWFWTHFLDSLMGKELNLHKGILFCWNIVGAEGLNLHHKDMLHS